MENHWRVGIPVIGSRGWQGGVSHMELHVKAVTALPKAERPALFLVVLAESAAAFPLYYPFITLFDGVIALTAEGAAAAEDIVVPCFRCSGWDELFTMIDFLFPVSFHVLPHRPAASWIHDFQHKYWPQFFSPSDISLRDELCARIAAQSALVFCSSQSVEDDFRRFYPESAAVTRVLALRVSPEEIWYGGDPLAVQADYQLPDRFILCCNQFWIHKNHRILFEALAQLRQAGQTIHLVCTGSREDFRYPRYMEELEEYIDELGISDQVHILGQIPRPDQIQLIRRCLFVVQPSLFEGLGLIVQECRTLGKPIILSDLPVHREHQYGITFAQSDSADLAAKIGALSALAQPGPDPAREGEARLQAIGEAAHYGRQFCQLVEEAQTLFHKKTQGVLLATSLVTNPTRMAAQIEAISSWIRCGCTVVSLNHPDDIPFLQSQFPQVTIVPSHRGVVIPGQGRCVFLDDLLQYVSQRGAGICGIIEPDICLYGEDLASALTKEGANCVVYQDKINVSPLQAYAGTLFPAMGCLFFDCRLAQVYPQSTLLFGQPLWDYWILLLSIVSQIPVKCITSPFAFHVIHNEKYDQSYLLSACQILSSWAPPPFALSEETVERYRHILAQMISNHTVTMVLPLLERRQARLG